VDLEELYNYYADGEKVNVIYFLVRQSFWELNMPDNEVFYAQRKDGTLVWSGMIQ
jgi:hypothetical protein